MRPPQEESSNGKNVAFRYECALKENKWPNVSNLYKLSRVIYDTTCLADGKSLILSTELSSQVF